MRLALGKIWLTGNRDALWPTSVRFPNKRRSATIARLLAPEQVQCPVFAETMNRASDQPQPNPLREGLSTRAVPQPCSIVIFGATGDLTHRKLIPALYNLAADGELPPAVAIIGFARRPKSDDDFRKEMEEATRNFSRQPVRDEIWKTFSQSLSYHQSEFGDEAGY